MSDFQQAVVYGHDRCPLCRKAKDLLEQKGIPYEYRDVTIEEAGHREYVEQYWKSLGKDRPTVPVVILDGFPVGGFTELQQVFS